MCGSAWGLGIGGVPRRRGGSGLTRRALPLKILLRGAFLYAILWTAWGLLAAGRGTTVYGPWRSGRLDDAKVRLGLHDHRPGGKIVVLGHLFDDNVRLTNAFRAFVRSVPKGLAAGDVAAPGTIELADLVRPVARDTCVDGVVGARLLRNPSATKDDAFVGLRVNAPARCHVAPHVEMARGVRTDAGDRCTQRAKGDYGGAWALDGVAEVFGRER